MEKVRVGQIGFGGRGRGLLHDIILDNDKAEVVAVCDLYEDRTQRAKEIVEEKQGTTPFTTLDFKEVVDHPDVDLVVITSAWESHVPLAVYAMEQGKPVVMEVGGAYSVEQCWELVKTYERTGTRFGFLENCCYGKRELMIKNMVNLGVMGEVIHCSGGYHHDLREEVSGGIENRHYRLRNYLNRNCENYPTHELGPIARLLGITRGNRMLSLTSTASKSAGLEQYIKDEKPADHPLANARFNQGDIITTTIKCAGGQTIVLTLDTTLPRYYSRGFTVRGTKAMYEECTDSIFIDKQDNEKDFEWKKEWGNAEKYEEQYLHPIWKKYMETGVQGSHDGMDWLEFDHVFDSMLEDKDFEIDVYDAATWMCITALSEKSIALGGAPVEVPDFTNGMWTMREEKIF